MDETPAVATPPEDSKGDTGFWTELGRWARYLYFLRFSLMLWFFAPALCLLNWKDQTLTSGILIPEFWQQYLCVGFFLVSAGLAALVVARIVVINGPERWDLDYQLGSSGSRPAVLTTLLVNDDGKWERFVVWGSQIPNLGVLIYLTWYGSSQGVAFWKILLGLLLGAALSGAFWWLANAWYYLTYRAPKADDSLTRFVLGKNAARTILYPRRWLSLNLPKEDFPGYKTIEQATTELDREGPLGKIARFPGFRWILDKMSSQQGYGTAPGYEKTLYESHYFALIAFAAFFGLYLVIWPLTAPVPAPIMSVIAIVALITFTAAILYVFWTANPLEVQATIPAGQTVASAIRKNRERKANLRRVQVWLTIGAVVFVGAVVGLALYTSAERFPILATLLIMMIAVGWLLGGMAFFLDRYRVPVLTVLILAMVFPRMLHWDRNPFAQLRTSQEEHYLSVAMQTQSLPAVPTPTEILKNRLAAASDDRPLIIVTATGGGLHASAWTATILGKLETQFGSDFHKHLLLASTVSGGSVGLLAYLRELYEGTLDRPDRDAAIARMESAAQCSSLEGVGWGLVYYDLPKAFVPVIPYLVPPSTGVNDLAGTPLIKDRTWSLRRSFERNLKNKYCGQLWTSDGNSTPAWTGPPPEEGKIPGSGLTLGAFLDTNRFPAFTMNTTAVELGERFLLANYRIPFVNLEMGPNYRARSFLSTFGAPAGEAREFPDLPLATAAQMSATFPYVSSAARVPMELDNAVNSVHFVDGGYYDNDGTASAIEFLHYALIPPLKPTTTAQEKESETKTSVVQAAGQEKKPPLRILLIEIRNSGGVQGSNPETVPDHIPGELPWNLFNQLGAPLLGFWQAGHESVTARNQSGLELLEDALGDKLQVHRIVFADLCSVAEAHTDPLNWSLTPKQRKEVRDVASRKLQTQYSEAKRWFDMTAWNRQAKDEDAPPSYVCDNDQ